VCIVLVVLLGGAAFVQAAPPDDSRNDVGETAGVDLGKRPVVKGVPWVDTNDLTGFVADLSEGAGGRDSVDQVRVEICEPIAGNGTEWPAIAPIATERWFADAFGFVEMPFKYVDTGVRGDREPAFLIRATAFVRLPAGRHRFLVRGRGATVLHLGGETLLATPFPSPENDGHALVRKPESWLDLSPEFHFAPPGVREAWCERDCEAGTYRVILESISGGAIGKSRRRPDLGELAAAISLEGEAEFRLISPNGPGPAYTEAGWRAYAERASTTLERLNARRRAESRSRSAPYWNRRAELTAKHLAETPDTPVPPPTEASGPHPVDRFLAADLSAALRGFATEDRGAVDFHRDVKPILDAHCVECHRGARAKGGFRLDVARLALGPTDAGSPAIVPGQPDESELISRIEADDDSRMPPRAAKPSAVHADAERTGRPVQTGPTRAERDTLAKWIREGARWPLERPARTEPDVPSDDLTFLRRVTLDVAGVSPSPEEIDAYLADPVDTRRERAVDRLLDDPRRIDGWMGFWQDLLAENPNILNPTLNNTGPFRWWLRESLADDKPLDLLVTELVRLRGSERGGGPAGFGVASQNDVPAASKGVILAGTFLGVDMKCARCHDSPTHASNQRELFELAGLLAGKGITVPATSSVPKDKLHTGGREPLIRVTLKPGTEVAPAWPFEDLVPAALAAEFAEKSDDPRDRLAALLTHPANTRFSQVFVNRVWHRFTGRGLFEPVHDWETGESPHPELLAWLAREFVRGGHRLKPLERTILTSRAYARRAEPGRSQADIWHTVGAARRMTAEQVVDSLFAAAGKPLVVEELSLDVDAQRDIGNSISLGRATRAWMLGSTSNERDRPSLALPRVQAVADLMEAFGWKGARPEAIVSRDSSAMPSQPAMVANSVVATWLTRLSDDHAVTALALEDQPVERFVERLVLRVLTRSLSADERTRFVEYLTPGYPERRLAGPFPQVAARSKPGPYVTWTNHLDPDATLIRQEEERRARAGDTPTARLSPEWREHAEDVLWSLLNAPECVFVP
jgi:hypothetical protein